MRRVSASRAPNGSSSSSTPGLRASARASAARCAMPPETCARPQARRTASSPTRRSSSSTRAAPASREVPARQPERDVLPQRAPRQQPGLLERHRAPLVDAVRRGAVDEHGAPVGGVQPADLPQQGRLAAAGRADERRRSRRRAARGRRRRAPCVRRSASRRSGRRPAGRRAGRWPRGGAGEAGERHGFLPGERGGRGWCAAEGRTGPGRARGGPRRGWAVVRRRDGAADSRRPGDTRPRSRPA